MGGSQPSSTTTNTPLTMKQYDPTGYKVRENLFPKLEAKYDQGLTDEEKSYYRGQGLGEVESAYAAGAKGLKENLARAGMGPGDGAYAESIADLLRQKMMGRAGVNADITGRDINQKQVNLQNLANLIANAGHVGTAGSTTTQSGGGGGVKDVIGGALGGGIGGYGLGTALCGSAALSGALGASPVWPLALGGALLGGLGGLF